MSDVVVEHSQPSQHESDERARRANRERLVRETAAAAGPQSNGPRVDEFALEEAGEGSADPDQQPADQQRPRLHFTVRDDVNLLKEVLRLDYFLSKDKMGVLSQAAQVLNRLLGASSGPRFTARGLYTRLLKLMESYRQNTRDQLRSSGASHNSFCLVCFAHNSAVGTEEECTERDTLLEEVVEAANDAEEAARSKRRKAAADDVRGIAIREDAMRRMAEKSTRPVTRSVSRPATASPLPAPIGEQMPASSPPASSPPASSQPPSPLFEEVMALIKARDEEVARREEARQVAAERRDAMMMEALATLSRLTSELSDRLSRGSE